MHLSVRDEASRDLLVATGVPEARITVTADPAFALEVPDGAPAPADLCRAAGVEPRGPILGVALRPWSIGVEQAAWESEVAAALEQFLEQTDGTLLFVPFEKSPWTEKDDFDQASRLAAALSANGREHVAIARAAFAPGHRGGPVGLRPRARHAPPLARLRRGGRRARRRPGLRPESHGASLATRRSARAPPREGHLARPPGRAAHRRSRRVPPSPRGCERRPAGSGRWRKRTSTAPRGSSPIRRPLRRSAAPSSASSTTRSRPTAATRRRSRRACSPRRAGSTLSNARTRGRRRCSRNASAKRARSWRGSRAPRSGGSSTSSGALRRAAAGSARRILGRPASDWAGPDAGADAARHADAAPMPDESRYDVVWLGRGEESSLSDRSRAILEAYRQAGHRVFVVPPAHAGALDALRRKESLAATAAFIEDPEARPHARRMRAARGWLLVDATGEPDDGHSGEPPDVVLDPAASPVDVLHAMPGFFPGGLDRRRHEGQPRPQPALPREPARAHRLAELRSPRRRQRLDGRDRGAAARARGRAGRGSASSRTPRTAASPPPSTRASPRSRRRPRTSSRSTTTRSSRAAGSRRSSRT